eukprot:scaffold64555_cov43-Attheya_sp.AAC.1
MTDVSTAAGRNYDHLSIRIPSEDAEDVLEHVNDERNGTHHASVLHLNTSDESPQNDTHTAAAAKMDETRIEASSSGLAKENASLRQQVHMMQVEIDRLREECEKKKKHHTSSSDDEPSTPERTSNRVVVAGGGTLDLLKSWIPGRDTEYSSLS